MQQNQTSSNVHIRTKVAIKEPKKYKVLIFDDDVTPVEFVWAVLKLVFFIEREEAMRIAENAMQDGKAVVGEYTMDIARSKVAKATQMASLLGFPLKFEIDREGEE
jgi:ATP-dependent Clp protease adaptor protein ClpS